jgi:predicted RNA binding protein YcfA (HicA-like mRNA interferase family)
MPPLPIISGRECVRALERAGFVVVRQRGSHIVLYRDKTMVVVPDHRTLDRGTLRAIIRAAGLTVEEFMRYRAGEPPKESEEPETP